METLEEISKCLAPVIQNRPKIQDIITQPKHRSKINEIDNQCNNDGDLETIEKLLLSTEQVSRKAKSPKIIDLSKRKLTKLELSLLKKHRKFRPAINGILSSTRNLGRKSVSHDIL